MIWWLNVLDSLGPILNLGFYMILIHFYLTVHFNKR